jgi:hypothetical protein
VRPSTRRRWLRLLIFAAWVPLLGACSRQAEEVAPSSSTQPGTLWNVLGSWSGRGDRQTESFDITTGSLRLIWEAREDGDPAAARFRVSLHSAISGRPLQTVVDIRGAGADSARVAADPRVGYLLIEADQVGWRVTLEEGVPTGLISATGGTDDAR